MRAITLSSALHLVLALLFFLFLNISVNPTNETPIEISELMRAIRNETPKTLKRASAPKPKDESAQKNASTDDRPATADGKGQATGEPTAEEYEVSSLPVLMTEVRIPYPAQARARRIQGAVVFQLIVGSDGRVTSAIPLKSPDSTLTDAALAAVKQFRFKPAFLKDKAVAIQITYTYRFVLE